MAYIVMVCLQDELEQLAAVVDRHIGEERLYALVGCHQHPTPFTSVIVELVQHMSYRNI